MCRCAERTRVPGKDGRIRGRQSRTGAPLLDTVELRRADVNIAEDGGRRSALDLLSFPDVDFGHLEILAPELGGIPREVKSQIERDALYRNYIARQERDVAALERDEARHIPEDLDYGTLNGLSSELAQKLMAARPDTLAQAARIEGMTPAALTLILARIRRDERRSA